MPVTHHVLLAATTKMAVKMQAAVITVTRPEQLAPALAQRGKSIAIENDEIKRKFANIALVESLGRWWLVPTLAAWILSQAISNHYKIEAPWRLNWKILSADGKITLTPTDHPQSQLPPPDLPN